MKWIAISGTWQKINEQVEKDVRETVREIMSRGDGIVSGGALGVDYFATDEALKLNPEATRIKIFIPTSLKTYREHYRKRAREGVVTKEQAEALINQLEDIKNKNEDALVENPENDILNKSTYFERITDIVNAADELIAFHTNNSEGTRDAIIKAEKKGITVKKFNYTI